MLTVVAILAGAVLSRCIPDALPVRQPGDLAAAPAEAAAPAIAVAGGE